MFQNNSQKEIEKNESLKKFKEAYCQSANPMNPRPPVTNRDWINSLWEKLLRAYENVDQKIIKDYLCWKNYEVGYLHSNWWYIIKHRRLVMDGFKCTKCGAIHFLEVHHLTYAYRGEEVKYMESIVTLCRDCHRKEHNLNPELNNKEYIQKENIHVVNLYDKINDLKNTHIVIEIKNYENLSIAELRDNIENNINFIIENLRL